MMSDYTPTTEEVRNSYASWSDAYPEFDRWLAEVKAEAWEEGAIATAMYFDPPKLSEPTNPYRQEHDATDTNPGA